MSVQRWTLDYPESDDGDWVLAMLKHSSGDWIKYADHARIVAERVAEVTDALIDARREALAELEQAHAAALAEEQQRGYAVAAALLRQERRDHAPRTLTADDPEPAVGSVALDKDGTAGQRVYTDDGVTTIWQFSDDDWCHEWGTVDRVRGPVTLIHDGEDR